MTAAKGKAQDADADNDTSYHDALMKKRGDAKRQAIEAAERSVAKARETLKQQEAELAKAKKENA